MDVVDSLEVRWAQGCTSQNVEFVDKTTVCHTCGNFFVFLDIETKMRSVFQCPVKGVGAFAANGNHGIFAFSEHGIHPSIFVFNYPDLELKNELKGTAKLEYTCLTLSDCGPYLACCSSIPDHTITVWNWETAEQLCTQSEAGKDVISLVFNPMNWLQICALGTTSLTVWHIERCDSFHSMNKSVVDLPAVDGSLVESEVIPSHNFNSSLTYFGPQMPTSAIARLTGDKADCFVPLQRKRARLTPSAICWTATSELYVGCKESFLLRVDPESLSISVLFNPTAVDAIPELQISSFESLALHTDGLIVAGKESVMHCLQIKGTEIQIIQTWHLEEPAVTLTYSPDYGALLLLSKTGRISRYKTAQPEKVEKVLDVLRGDFVAGTPLHTDNNVCVSVLECGELQVWSSDGLFINSISLQTKATCLACCPVAQYVAVGTATGHILIIDLICGQQPRLVHKVHLYHVPTDHIVFDQGGNYFLTGALDSHIYVLDAKPSKGFSVLGFTVAPGPILSLSTQYMREMEQVKVLALCTVEKDKENGGSLMAVLSLPVKDLSGPPCVDLQGCLSDDVLKGSIYEVPNALKSSVLGVRDIFAYCHQKKTLQKFKLPEDTTHPSSKEVVQLSPVQEVKGHPLGPASLVLSPDQLWLASVGQDGLLRVWQTTSMEHYVEMQCHSFCWGGIRSVSFSADSQTVLTAGLRDSSLVCTKLRLKEMVDNKGDTATQDSRPMVSLLEKVLKTENLVLGSLPDWSQQPLSPDGSELNQEGCGAPVSSETDTHRPSQKASDPTWFDDKVEAVMNAENEQCSQTKNSLRRSIKELCDTIQEMMRENESLPEIERLEQQEFNLDVEEQSRLEVEGEHQVTRVRNDIELENLGKCYLRDVLKKECWDPMKIKGKSIKAFHSEHEVRNYPMKERTEEDMDCLQRVQNIRKIEKADGILQQEILVTKSKTATDKGEDEEEEGHEGENAALLGSFSAQLGCSNPYLYDQFNLHFREQKINQIVLLKDVIYKVKMAFNAEFEAVHKQKEQEIVRVKDKNRRIMEIMAELDIQETLWEPSLSDSERPESALTVEDSEVKVQKYLTPEQRKKEEEKKRLEEERRLAAKGDNLRKRALGDMMGGVLELKKEDILKMVITEPEFALNKPEIQWSKEEKKLYKEYEKKAKELSEEQEKYRKTLEVEIKKLQASIKDSTKALDETLTKLFQRKVKSEMVIYQEELKMANLVFSILTEEEIINRELELSLKLKKKRDYKREIEDKIEKYKAEVDVYHETYDSVVAEDKLLDKGFRKEFFDVPAHVVDNLYKLYKRRPRVQRTRTQSDINISPFKGRLLGGLASANQMHDAMGELDAVGNMPEGLDLSIWDRFCMVRRAKVETEQQVKIKALILAEMQAFLQKRIDEDEAVKQEIKILIDELNGLREEKKQFLLDIMVQVLIKQGQVEVPPTDFISDYSDSALHHRSVVEDLNRTIRMSGEQKIAWMVECKDFRKGIIQEEWEHKRMTMHIEDLYTKARDIQMLRVTEELQEYLREKYHVNTSKKGSNLEKTKALEKQTHKNVTHRQMMIKQLNMQAKLKTEKNAILDQQIANLQVVVAERKHIHDAIAVEESREQKTKAYYQEIVKRKKLVDLAQAQAKDLALLSVEVEALRMKTFPAFLPLKDY